MFFILSKTLGYALRPFFLIALCLGLSWFIKRERWRRMFFTSGMVMLFLFSNEFIANEFMLAWELPPTLFADTKQYEYGIVLSGAVGNDVGPEDRVYIKGAADRVNHTLQLYKTGHIKKIVVSGGSGRLLRPEDNEAAQLGRLLVLMGVPSSDIILESASRNTHESAVAVKELLSPLTKPEQTLIITSASHQRRSRACFEKAGWPADSFSVDFFSHRRQFTPDILLVPKVEAINTWTILLKEWAGMVTYKVVGYI